MRKNIIASGINYFIIAFATLPLVSHFISVTLGGIFYIGLSYLLAVLSILINRERLKCSQRYLGYGFILFLTFAGIYAIGTQIFSDRFRVVTAFVFDITVNLNNFISNLPIFIAAFYVFLKSETSERRKYYNFFLLCLLYTVVITLVALIAVPDYAKNEAAGSETGNMRMFAMLGANGFALSYSLTIIAPVFFYFFRKEKKIILLLISLFGSVVAILSGFLIGSLVLIGNIIFSLILSIKSTIARRITCGLVLATVVYFLINIELIGEFALFLSHKISIASISRRLAQIANVILYQDFSGDAVSGRLLEYTKSWDGIKEHPFLGNILIDDLFAESGHSTVMDSWACFGFVLASIFLIGLLLLGYGTVKGEKRSSARNIIFVSIFSLLVVAIFNPILSSTIIYMYCFLTYSYFAYLKEDELSKIPYKLN